MTSGTYYTCSSSSVNVLSTLQLHLDGHTSKALTISDTLFGTTSDSCTAYLNAEWQCGRNGGWSNWGTWSDCPVICGGGVSISRTRACDNPSFVSPGSYCSGDATETQYCNTHTCDDDAQLDTHRGPWTLVYKAPAGTTVSGYSDYYTHFIDSTSSSTLNDGSVSVMRDFSSGGSAFKSSKLLQWKSGITISAVRLSVFKSGKEVAYVIFDALGKGKLDWFNCDNIIGSSYTDIATYSENYCGLSPWDSNYKRNFFINGYGTGCTTMYGWIVLKDFNSVSGCTEWDPSTTSSPYIKYSTSTTLQNFYSGSVSNGDSLAIFIMEWHMVFKGVQGVTPTAGSLVDLWTGSTVENDNDDSKTTITTSPGSTVKSSLVEDWEGYFTLIDMVKYAYFTSGDEKAYVVFDGRGTTKITWFADGKEIYSSYSDVTTDTPTTSGIAGDTYRKFALIRTSSSCSGFYAWMMVLDVGKSVLCSFDNNVQTRPYFLYSSTTTDRLAESGSSWDSSGFPAADTLGIFVKGFYPVMKWARGQSISPASSVYDLWTGTYTLNEFTTSAHSFAASTSTYKSSLVDSWSSYYFTAVRVSMYTSGVETAYVVFDAHGSDKSSWFDCDRILYTNFQDLNRRTSSLVYCSIAGDTSASRRFFIEYTYSSCGTAGGWIGVFEGSSCSYDNKATSPFAMYSDASPARYEYNDNMAIADVFVISVAMDDFCDFSPCQNGGTCYHRGVKYECVCDGAYYGLDCADLDGNFTTWTDWNTCSTTCYAWGTQSRTRTCTNPTPAGPNGQGCTGDTSETQGCIPNLATCPVYNTGDIQVDLSYTMVCQSGLYIFVSSAFYGYSTTCFDTDPLSDVRVACHGQATNCTITFNDATFGGNPCSSYSVTKYGYATMYCVESLMLSTFQGPWRLVFKSPTGTAPPSGHADVASFYLSSDTVNDGTESVMTDFSSGGSMYKSALLNEWGVNRTFSAVRYSVYKNDEEVAYIVYNGQGTSKDTWMNCDNILYSSYTDIKTVSKNYCDIKYTDTTTFKHSFYVSSTHGVCNAYAGWVFIKDYGSTTGCSAWAPYDGSRTEPYVVYSTASTLTQWSSGNVGYADAIGIFVQDWHMVFKGVDGVTPSAGNLETLWEGTTTEYNGDETVKTINNIPAVSYKSAVVEDWASNWTIIDQVKYSFFKSGEEEAHVVFDGINTNKNTWMDPANVLFSLEFGSTVNATTASISGDGTRSFAVIEESGTCAALSAWMLVLDDASGSTTCSFDNNVRTRPYFLYSNSGDAGHPESSSSWDSVNFPYADTLGIFIIGWFPVMKVAYGESVSPATGIYNLWTGTYTLNEYDFAAYSMSTGTLSYKSSIVDSWASIYKQAVRVAFSVGGEEKAYVVFDAHSSTKTSWFNCDRILYTSYADLTRDTTVLHCSVAGNNNRHFFIEETYGSGCDGNFGWFGIIEGSTCSYDSKGTTPFPLYSDAGFSEANDDMVVPEVFSISIARDNMCGLVTCLNGGTCYDWGARFECVCAGDYYGGACQNLNGGWTSWSAWTDCSTTCYAHGTQTRERNCTNPTTAGDGVYCIGYSNQTEFCIPDNLDICSQYSTGDIAEGDNYTMVCPTHSLFYIHIYDASYGNVGQPCLTSDPVSIMRTACHGSTTSCNVIFNDATFGGDPCSSYPSLAKSGYITYFCAKSRPLDEARGPWSLVFKAPRGTAPPSGHADIMSLYTASGPYNEDVTAAMTDFSASGSLYKSAKLDQWGSNLTVTTVKVAIYTGGTESAHVIFDATGKGKDDWFDCTKIIDSSWNDIETGNKTCTLNSGDTYKRIFHISSDYAGCSDETGWFMFKDYGASSGCSLSDATSTAMPYMLYSTLGLRTVWSSASKATGDCLAIFVMDWHMVFKAVAGDTSPGSLETLWGGTTLLNDGLESATSITNTPASGYKSSAVEAWSDDFTFIDMVKYAYFTGGVEKAWIVFDGVGTSKTTWFQESKILFSSYTDIGTAGKTTVSVTGDGIRSFAVIDTYPNCDGLMAWMMVSDFSSSTNCAFDSATTKPYFIYSSTDVQGSPQSGSSYDSAAFPQADVMGIFIHGWFPVMKVSKDFGVSPASGIYDLWTNTYTVNEYNDSLNAFSFAANTMTYKSRIPDSWASYYIRAVRLSFITSGIERAYVVFDAHGSSKTSWLSCDRILYSSWTDLNREGTKDRCTMIGDASATTYFSLLSNYGKGSCSTQSGWFTVIDSNAGSCTWESKDSTYPHVVYSDTTTVELNTGFAVADVFAISISMDNICDIVTCENGATCLDWGGRYSCSCDGDHYGHLCQNINGNYTAWSDWTDCSTTCYAQGVHTRNRTCTTPTPLGIGLDCTGMGPADELELCIPTHLDICDEYNTGDVPENTAYTMVCPADFYIHVYAAFFGNGATCSDATALADAQTACHQQTDSCVLTFSNTTFGSDPCSGHGVSNYGSATMYCAKHQQLEDWRGPWRLVFKVPKGASVPAGYADVNALYSASGSYNEDDTSAKTDFSASGSIYKSALLDQWGDNLTVNSMRLSVFKDGSEKAYIVFDTSQTTKSNWFDCSKIIDSSYHDIVDGNTTCTLNDGGTGKRTFYISSDYSGCTNETGWIMMKDYGASTGCSEWDSTSITRPYIYFSGLGTRVQWSTADKVEADSFALFIVEWHMVFKAIQGLAPTTYTNLVNLWTTSITENEYDTTVQSLTNSPSKAFKSGVVDTWSDTFTFIDMVKYSHFLGGVEKAWVVFDGVDTTKTTWFADSKILFSSYKDIKTGGKSRASVTGDGMRSFSLIYTESTCDSTTAWMFMLDYGTSSTCRFDTESRVVTKPYFLYSNTDSYGNPQVSNNWDSVNFPYADVMGIFIKGWFPVLKVAKGMDISPATGIYDLWTSTYILNEYNDTNEAFSFAADTMTYKSSIVDNWSSYYFRAVRLSFYTAGSEAGFVVFDAHGSDKTSWFSCDRILYTSWTDLNRYATKDYCSVSGDSANSRYFFLENSLGASCDVSRGWFGVMEASSGSCTWETKTTRPYAMYSSGTKMDTNAAMSVADVFAISVSMDNICDIVTCENGATCLDWGVTYRCLCEDGFYGWLCQNIDGNYTTWTDWADCSTTCYAAGTQYRTRTCTNPTPLGIGQDCTRYGEPSQTMNCIPTHLDVCSEYNTGDMSQETSYIMVCPSDFYIHVYAAYYGDGTLCSDANALADVRTVCHLQTDQCNVTFSDTFFSGNPCTAYPGAVVAGSAKFYCAKSRERDNLRGPWRLVFKAPSGTAPPAGYADIMALYDASGAYNEFETAAMTDFSAGGTIYKSIILDNWGVNTTVSAVKLSVFDNGREVQYAVFNAIGKDKTNWFDCDNIVESSWHDLPDGNRTCTKSTADTWKRNFYLQSDYPTCTNETGWFLFKDYGASSGCAEWDVTTSLPKIFYSQTPERVVWSSGNMATADAMAIFVMDWHMVFKGVESVTPAAGSMATLWTGADTENDNDITATTLTKSPNLAYKSSLLENWADPFTFIDMVKYAFFTGGVEKSYVVFDGRSTSKTSWFTSSKILFSSYSDIKTASIDHCSITSDTRRKFLITHDVTTSCASYQMWMATLDVGGSTYCNFDNYIVLGASRPNFLYSSSDQYAYPLSSGTWDSASVPRADVMGVFIIGWYPLMKVAKGVDLSPATGVYDLWTGTYTLNEYNDTDTAFSFAASTMPFKSSVVDNWSSYYFKAVRVSFYVTGEEKAFVVFDAHGTDKNSWFNCEKILYTSWPDVNRYANRDYCSIVGDSAKNRRMFMASSYGDTCSTDSGWFGVVEDSTTTCSWEQKTSRPFAIYSDTTSLENFDDMAVADVFAISMSKDSICDIVECENGGTCYDWGARYRCFCDGYFYGWLCQNLDGNWTTWTDWSACSTSCYAIGTQYRYRNCTEPAPVGHGLDCGYPDLEVQTCVPDHDVCPEYNTGNLFESKNYTMICPVGFYIYVDDAYYGDGTNCATTDAINRLRGYCHEQTDSCQFFFTDSYFGGDPCASYPSAVKYGYAKLNCIKRDILDSYRGPWRLVFKAPAGKQESGYTDVKAYYDATASSTESDADVTDKRDFSTSAGVFKSKHLDEWGTSVTAQAVRLSVWKNGKEVHYVVFDAFGKTKSDWLDCSKILYSSWHDLDATQNVTCQIREDNIKKRTFYLSRGGYTSCTDESGWLMYKDLGASSGCSEWDPTSGLPAIKYSTATEHVTWATGPTGDADALAIYIMDWFMAFKGVQGVTASTGSLKSLWESEETENYLDTTAKTVSTAPGLTFKSSLLELWLESFTFIEMVKYGFYSGGAEVAFVIFDGRGTTKDSWFNCANILFSSYDDIVSQSKSHCSIQGDDIRNFAILKQGGTSCANVQGWMMLSENSTEPCVFDRASNVEANPFFLYSSSSIYNTPQNAFTYYSAGMPAADTMGVFVKGWFPAFHIAHAGALYSASSIYDLFTGTYIVNEYNETAFSLDTYAMTFKSSAIDGWDSLYIQAVRVSFFKNNVEVAYVVFDGHATTKTNWFDCDRILYSSYRDLTRETPTDFCSIAGDTNRRFFLEASYGLDCDANSGWFGVVEGAGTCGWETLATPPFFLYSDANTVEENSAMEVADSFVISLAMDNICSTVDCLYGATCDDQAGRYDCICAGDYYGWLCQHLDGNWTAWSDWDTCSTTCYAEGGQNRYRNCTNPAPVGDGLYCPGVDIEFQYCIPDLSICTEYNTGNIQENGWYHMVCPSSYYMYIDSNFYGFDSDGPNECSDPNAFDILFDQCHNVTNGSCRFYYDEVNYDDPCNKTYSQITNYGFSLLYCARDGVWNAWQPWSFCSVTCGGGTRYRERVCDNPERVWPGNDCPDVYNDSKPCKPQACPVCGDHYAGYDEPSNITVFNDTRVGMGFLLLDVNWDFPCCEVIQAFEFVPRVAGEIYFHIWRKFSSTKYELLHKTNYTVNDTEIGSAINHSLPLKKRLSVRQGDFLGWFTPGENMIKYAECCCEGCPNQTWVAPLPANLDEGDKYRWTSLGTKLSDVAYAIRFFTAPNTVPYVNQTLYDALVPDNTPIGGSCINYHVTDDDIGDGDLLTHSFVDTTGLFELNTTFPGNIHIQTTNVLPSTYSVFELVLNTADDCQNTATTTLTIMTYNAPPIFINLPDSIEVSEALVEEAMLFEIDAVDQSENDSVCCTLTEVIPGSLNFQMKFINNTYRLYTVENPVFSYKDISDYYKVYFCCSDDHGISTQFLEIFMIDVEEVIAYVPPTWFLTAISVSMVPVTVTFVFACMVMLNTLFCDAEIEYYYE
ncbi:Hemicentin-1 [Mizuhopecten yessoensis]|uniref:Hemicentin-1 n=2 Tax=Mizuhopecten yessoensis TaxID=6573 RepID=A0A210R714_MIZYE|nr:Hemicentin-1 [Mizuhopecten yessoensis]